MKYSVIVPIYNAERSLRRCVDSILAEAYPDMELILINDGSTDSSAEICRAYAAQKECVLFLSKENGGVSTARNAGLDAASGSYVLFVDSDDSVLPGFFATLDHTLAKQPCDWIQFSFRYVNGNERRDLRLEERCAFSREQLMPLIVDATCRKTLNSPCGKLYRRDLIEAQAIRFPEGVSVAEDRVFNLKYSLYIHSYSVSDVVLYCVNTENESSLSRKRHEDLKQQFAIADRHFDQALLEARIPEKEKEQYRQAVNFGSCRAIYHDAKLLHLDGVAWAQRQKKLAARCKEINARHMAYPGGLYCRLISLPVSLGLTPVIDLIAWKLTH